MLAFKTNDTWATWSGQPRPFNGEGSYNLSSSAEAHYRDDELETFGLYRVQPALPPPEGKRVMSTRLADVNGRPVLVAELEDIPAATPSDATLTMRQLRLGLVENGFGAGFIPSVIATIPAGIEQDRATVWYEETVSGIEWAHPMTQALMAAAAQVNPSFTLELAAQMWLDAATNSAA